MSGRAQFLTIAGRWKRNAAISGIDKFPRKEQALAMMMFYAGFSAALEANLEIAEFPEDEAVQLMQALDTEVKQIEAMATHLFSGRPAS